MGLLDHLTEQKIRAAIQRGEFDNLPGAGKPIRWKDNPLAPEDEKLGFDLLQNNGFTLPWIEKRQQIKAERSALRQMVRGWLQGQRASVAGEIPPELLERLARLNEMIIDYNRGVPVEALQVSFVDLHRELNASQFENPDLQ